MIQVELSVPEIHCEHCKASLEGAVGAVPGVDSVEVSVSEATVSVSYDAGTVEESDIRKTIEEQGYAVAD
jgi:copper chaperone